MEMSVKQLNEFRRDFSAAVSTLEKKYGVTISLGRITYGEERFTTKMTVINGTDPEDVARALFDADVWKYEHLGLEAGMYNRVFVAKNGRRYAIKGFNTKAPKYPLLIKDIMTGDHHRAPENFIDHFEDMYSAD